MEFHDDLFYRYLCQAPLPLAMERTQECRLFTTKAFVRPTLDIGCGDGVFAGVLFREPIDVGVDIDAAELERAALGDGYRSLIQCSASDIPFPDGHFKTIMSNSVLEHVRDLEPVLREVHRLLASDGLFYATVPTESYEQYSLGTTVFRFFGSESMARRYAVFFNRFWKHYHALPVPDWVRMLERAGLRVVQSSEYGSGLACRVQECAMPVALASACTKRRTGRWIRFPRWRQTTARALDCMFRSLVFQSAEAVPGGMVQLVAEKAE